MEFSKPVCTEIEGDADAKKLREYFVENGIAMDLYIERRRNDRYFRS